VGRLRDDPSIEGFEAFGMGCILASAGCPFFCLWQEGPVAYFVGVCTRNSPSVLCIYVWRTQDLTERVIY